MHADEALVIAEFFRGQSNLFHHHHVCQNVHLALVSSNFHRKPTFSIHGLGRLVYSDYNPCVVMDNFYYLDYVG